MFEGFLAADRRVSAWLQDWGPSWVDELMGLASNSRVFVPAMILLVMVLAWRKGRRGWLFLCALLCAAALTETLSSHLLKPIVARARPVGSGWSFPSSHAANMAGQAWLWTARYPRAALGFWCIAGMVGLSRVYLSRHWASDVVGGWALGCLAGWLVCLAWKRSGLEGLG